MGYSHPRTICFADTDGAGVVYFAQIFSICHEAYEAALAAQGINLRDFFSNSGVLAVPIVHAEANFRQPMFCGDRITITLEPQQLSSDSYLIKYEIHKKNLESSELQLAAQAQTKHICIDAQARSRRELPTYLHQWLTS